MNTKKTVPEFEVLLNFWSENWNNLNQGHSKIPIVFVFFCKCWKAIELSSIKLINFLK